MFIFSNYSIFHALDLNRIEREKIENKEKSCAQKVSLVFKSVFLDTFRSMLFQLFILTPISNYLVNRLIKNNPRSLLNILNKIDGFVTFLFIDKLLNNVGYYLNKVIPLISFLNRNVNGINSRRMSSLFYLATILGPLTEEIVFRLIIQNAFYYVQKFVNWAAPSNVKNTRLFEWVISPSARIILTNSCFALTHLLEVKKSPVRIALVVSQAARIFLYPKESILYETTNTLVAPITNHIAQNTFGTLMSFGAYALYQKVK